MSLVLITIAVIFSKQVLRRQALQEGQQQMVAEVRMNFHETMGR